MSNRLKTSWASRNNTTVIGSRYGEANYPDVATPRLQHESTVYKLAYEYCYPFDSLAGHKLLLIRPLSWHSCACWDSFMGLCLCKESCASGFDNNIIQASLLFPYFFEEANKPANPSLLK